MKLDPIIKFAFAGTLVALAPTVSFASGSDEVHAGGQHPAVIVAHRGVAVDPTTRFYLHPAHLSWSLTRPMEAGEHPAVIVAHRLADPALDPNQFIPGHPAGGYGTPAPTL